MAREIRPGMYWIEECGPDRSHFVEDSDPDWHDDGQELHIPQNAYLIDDDETLLFDTLSPASTDVILEEVASVLDGRELDYLVVSHPDVPHAGNAHRLLEAYPEATLVAPRYGQAHELYHLDEALQVGEGDAFDLGERTVAFHEATFPDAALHMWMTEETTETLFPVDWFGYPHTDAECSTFANEFDHPITVDRLVEFHGRVLFWFQYVDPETVSAETRHLIERYDPEIIAPAHGNVIREDAVEYMRLLTDVVERVSEQGRVGTLG